MLVFQSLYKEHCFSAFLDLSKSLMFAEDLCTRIQEHMDYLCHLSTLTFRLRRSSIASTSSLTLFTGTSLEATVLASFASAEDQSTC